ncbi:MAG TPA: DegV family protein [Acidimicrobiales bacterium]|jgi:DegV family protein with EDD domain|nr:DegV family protein [Acidimicrobiales bacterium]
MAGIRIVTDSSCDLPFDLAEKHQIDIVPLTIRFGSDEYVDRRDLTPKEFWAKVKASPVLPETAAPAPGLFEEAYRRAKADGCTGVVAVTLSSDLSATYQAAELAARSVADEIPVRVVDSRSLTTALGLMVITAAETAESGASIDEVVDAVEDIIPRTEVYAALDTLDNLKKGGRIGGAQAFLGSMLSIKPIINVSGGKVEQESKQRTRSKSLKYLADKVRDAGELSTLAVVHGDAPDVDEMLDLLAPVYPREKIIVADLGAVIGTHGGPRTLGITYQRAR